MEREINTGFTNHKCLRCNSDQHEGECDPTKETMESILQRNIKYAIGAGQYEEPAEEMSGARLKSIVLPKDTLRDHINYLVMDVLAREKAKGINVWGEATTLRDQFAMATLTGLMSVAEDDPFQLDSHARRAEWCYNQADAMLLEARKRKEV